MQPAGALIPFGLLRLRTASVLFTNAAMHLVGVGHGFVRLDQPDYSNRGMVWGFVLLLVAGLAMWRFMRIGPALLVAGLGLMGLSIDACKELFSLHGNLRGGLALLGVSAWMDRAAKRPPSTAGSGSRSLRACPARWSAR